MILNNFKKLMITYEEAVFKDFEGNEFKTTDVMRGNRICMSLSTGITPILTPYYTSLFMGTGKNPVTPNDYSMDLITTGWINESFTSTFDVTGDTPIITLKRHIKNTGTTTITANEIGVYYTIPRHADYGGLNRPILIYRDVPLNPLVIQPNETASLTVELKIEGV